MSPQLDMKHALHESEEQIRLIIESVRDYAIFTLDMEGRITSWNVGAEAVFGWPDTAIIGQPAAVLFPVEDREAGVPERELAKAFEQGGAANEHWLVRRDGRRLFASEVIRPLYDARGRVRGAVKVARDETERRKAEDALRRSEESFRTLANSIPQLAWMADAEGWIFWYNDRWFAYTGTRLEEMKGWGWRKVHHPDHVEQVVRRITHAWTTGEPWEDTFPLRGRDGKYRWFLSRALPIRDEEGCVVRWFGTNTDITEQREAEERQALLTREISHRVKNSLQLVASLLGIQAKGSTHEEVRSALEDAWTRVQTIAQVHDHLWKRREVTTIELAEFLASLCAGLRATAPLHRIVYESAGTISVPTDRAIPIGLLLNELVTNAVKYAYPASVGGEIHVRLSLSDPGHIRLEVADRGQGLAADFDLQRANASLGLRLMDSLTRQLGGTLRAISAEPGARFMLDVPMKCD
jgi:PAS domain S-box-containing protein